MTHLIGKDAVLAEINNRLEELWDSLPNASDVIKDNYTKKEANATGKYTALESFRDYIDTLEVIEIGVDFGDPKGDKSAKYIIDTNTLEVKEVDLEREINKYISDNFFGSETMGFFAVRTKEEPNDMDMALCAKHFFELGLKAQKGE